MVDREDRRGDDLRSRMPPRRTTGEQDVAIAVEVRLHWPLPDRRLNTLL